MTVIRGEREDLLAAGFVALTREEFEHLADEVIPLAYEIQKQDGHSHTLEEVRLHFYRWWHPLYVKKD